MTTVLGPVIYRSKFKSKVPVKVVPLKSGFKYQPGAGRGIGEIC
jgi:hypothetical protein